MVWLALLVAIAAPFAVEWASAQTRLPDVQMEVRLDPPDVVADGKSQVVLYVRVTENGQPRAGDLLQSWIQVGGGILRPEWAYTDTNGEAAITFYPNPLTQYDVQDRAAIQIADISIGRLIEVRKLLVVDVPLRAPEQPAERKRNIIG
jgi:hypothetical protein